jgi:hypothetical protein
MCNSTYLGTLCNAIDFVHLVSKSGEMADESTPAWPDWTPLIKEGHRGQRCEELVLHFGCPTLVSKGTSEIALTSQDRVRVVRVIKNPPAI